MGKPLIGGLTATPGMGCIQKGISGEAADGGVSKDSALPVEIEDTSSLFNNRWLVPWRKTYNKHSYFVLKLQLGNTFISDAFSQYLESNKFF